MKGKLAMANDGDARTTLKTIERGLDVLEIVAASDTPLTTKDIAERLQHNLSSTYHIVNTLQSREYLDKNERGELSMGRRIGLLNASLVRSADFTHSVRPLISRLAASCGETVYLTRWMNGSAVIQIVIESQRSLRVTGLDVGYSGSEEKRASGKAVLAQLAPAHMSDLTERMFEGEPKARRATKLKHLARELDEVRVNGFAFDNEDYEPGVCCIAAPYYLPSGAVGGSVAVSAPALRVKALLDEIRPDLVDTADAITEALRGMPA